MAFWFGGLLIEGTLLVERGLLLWPSGVISVMAFWYGLLVRPSGVIFCYGLLAWPSREAFWCGGLLLWPSG